MNINELTLGQLREVGKIATALVSPTTAQPVASPFEVGKAYMIRTVTMAWCGRVVAADAQFLQLKDAAWVADLGRYHQAIERGSLSEVEPVPGTAIIGVGAIVDAVEWVHALPLMVK